ncbi:MAG: hypothetical protein QOC62_122 [Mycobacterium sp.]|jgi:quinol monooxygenase YgiN|nr:hypothetical protein [Mycobacterium sp.]
MVIVAGHRVVEPAQRARYLAGCKDVVEQARGTTGCLEFSITADLLDPARIVILERWSPKRRGRSSAAVGRATSRPP